MISKKINYELLLGFADKLKRLRENSFIDIGQLVKELKLPAKDIIDLENGKIDKYHDLFYLKLSYRNYAQSLKLNKKEIDYQLEQIFQIEPQFKNWRIFPRSRRKITLSGAVQGLATIIIISYIGYLIYGLFKPPQLTINNPPIQVQGDNFELSGKTNINANIYINNNLIATDLFGNFNSKIILKPGKNLIAIKAVNLYSKKSREQVIEIQARY